MAAVVHPASAGTTAAGLRAGTPAVTIPMSTDQPFWAHRLTAIGTAPPPLPYRRLTRRGLAAAITDAVTRQAYRTRAKALASQLASEDGPAPIIKALERR